MDMAERRKMSARPEGVQRRNGGREEAWFTWRIILDWTLAGVDGSWGDWRRRSGLAIMFRRLRMARGFEAGERRSSSTVEHRFRKAGVKGSNPFFGFEGGEQPDQSIAENGTLTHWRP